MHGGGVQLTGNNPHGGDRHLPGRDREEIGLANIYSSHTVMQSGRAGKLLKVKKLKSGKILLKLCWTQSMTESIVLWKQLLIK